MVRPDTHPTRISANVINSIWIRPPQLGVYEIMNLDLFRRPFGAPRSAIIFELSDQLFFFGVNRDDWLALGQSRLDMRIDVFKLCVPVRVSSTFEGLFVGLNTVAQFIEKIAHRDMTHPVALTPQFFGQRSQTLACPSQWRLRIAARKWFHQPLKVLFQRQVLFCSLFSTGARSSYSTIRCVFRSGRTVFQLLEAGMNGPSRDSCIGGYLSHASSTQHPGFRSSQKPSLPFIEHPFDKGETFSNVGVIHAHSYSTVYGLLQ